MDLGEIAKGLKFCQSCKISPTLVPPTPLETNQNKPRKIQSENCSTEERFQNVQLNDEAQCALNQLIKSIGFPIINQRQNKSNECHRRGNTITYALCLCQKNRNVIIYLVMDGQWRSGRCQNLQDPLKVWILVWVLQCQKGPLYPLCHSHCPIYKCFAFILRAQPK